MLKKSWLVLSCLSSWIVVTSTVRSVVKIRNEIGGLWLLLAGLLVSGLGIIFHLIALQVISAIQENRDLDLALNMRSVGFYVGVGIIASVISLINIKVKNQFWGNVLEVLFIATVALAIFLLV